MRALGFVIAIIGGLVVYLGWQGKMLPALRALAGLDPWGGSTGGGPGQPYTPSPPNQPPPLHGPWTQIPGTGAVVK